MRLVHLSLFCKDLQIVTEIIQGILEGKEKSGNPYVLVLAVIIDYQRVGGS